MTSKTKMRMQERDEKGFAFEYEFSLRMGVTPLY